MLELSLSEIATDKDVLIYDGELAEGIEVFVKDENEEMQVPGNGDYATEDKVITVEDGKIVKIAEKEVQETEEKLSFNESKVKMSASYNEIYRNIQAAVDNLGVEGYVISAGDDFTVISVWEDNKEVFYRYGVITNEDGSIVLGEKKRLNLLMSLLIQSWQKMCNLNLLMNLKMKRKKTLKHVLLHLRLRLQN